MRFGAFAEDVAVGVRVLLRRFGHGGLSRFGGAGRGGARGRPGGRTGPSPVAHCRRRARRDPRDLRDLRDVTPAAPRAPYKYSPASLG
ncbi:hypothetical protein GCM10020254_64720 [Streptomyces goshikiensis]